MEARKYPFDPSRILKGTRFSVTELEAMTRMKHGTQEYQFRLMFIGDAIERWSRATGDPVVTKTDQGELLILTDAEAAEYTAGQFDRHLRRVAGNFRQMTQVDVSKLTEDERRLHERNLVNKSKLMQALAQAGAPIRLVSYQRSLPGLPSANTKE